MAPTKRAVLNGGMDDMEEYRKKVGWLTGIHAALDAQKTIADILASEVKRREENDEPLT